MHCPPSFAVVAPEHPSLAGAVGRFCEVLRREAEQQDPAGLTGTLLQPDLIRRLGSPSTGIRLAAAADGEILALGVVDGRAAGGPELLVAATRQWHHQGVDAALARALVARAGAAGVTDIRVFAPPECFLGGVPRGSTPVRRSTRVRPRRSSG